MEYLNGNLGTTRRRVRAESVGGAMAGSRGLRAAVHCNRVAGMANGGGAASQLAHAGPLGSAWSSVHQPPSLKPCHAGEALIARRPVNRVDRASEPCGASHRPRTLRALADVVCENLPRNQAGPIAIQRLGAPRTVQGACA